jgi:hypothetical protein
MSYFYFIVTGPFINLVYLFIFIPIVPSLLSSAICHNKEIKKLNIGIFFLLGVSYLLIVIYDITSNPFEDVISGAFSLYILIFYIIPMIIIVPIVTSFKVPGPKNRLESISQSDTQYIGIVFIVFSIFLTIVYLLLEYQE